MVRNKSTYIVLFLIVVFAGSLRFYQLGRVPAGLHRDEAFLGYNAFSILKTGKDISNNYFPIHLQSYLYSPAGYSYASIPWIALFGLNPFSVRFASALSGTLTVLLTFFLVRLLMKHDRQETAYFPLLSAALIAISPWHINLSRTATENTLVVFFITLGVMLFRVWSLNGSRFILFISFISLTLTLGIYQAPRAFLPLFIPFLFFLFPQKNIHVRSRALPIFLYVTLILLPLFSIIRSPALSLRLNTVSLFATQESQLVIDEQVREDGVLGIPVYVTRFFHNKLRAYSEQFIHNYFSHFTYDFLFTDKGLPDRYRVPGAGLMYLIELPFALSGIYWILVKKQRELNVLIIWLLLGFVGSALTFDDVPNLQRTLIVFPVLPIVCALGFIKALTLIRSKQIPFFLFHSVTVLCLLYYAGSYLHSYYSHQLVHRPWYRQEGYEQLVKKVNALVSNYDNVVITNRESAPAILFLLYSAYDPQTFQKETEGRVIKDYDRINFSRFEFSQEQCPFQEKELIDEKTGTVSFTHTAKAHTLYVNWGQCPQVKKFGTVIDTIYRNDVTPVFTLVSPMKSL